MDKSDLHRKKNAWIVPLLQLQPKYKRVITFCNGKKEVWGMTEKKLRAIFLKRWCPRTVRNMSEESVYTFRLWIAQTTMSNKMSAGEAGFPADVIVNPYCKTSQYRRDSQVRQFNLCSTKLNKATIKLEIYNRCNCSKLQILSYLRRFWEIRKNKRNDAV